MILFYFSMKKFSLYKQMFLVQMSLHFVLILDLIVNPEILSKDANESSESRR